MYQEIYPEEVSEWLKRGARLIDVREEWEYESGHLPKAINIPLGRVGSELEPDGRPVVLVCASGGRSGQAASLLSANGFSEVANLLGGTAGWVAQRRRIEK